MRRAARCSAKPLNHASLAVAALLFGTPPCALACGVCAEDRIAATYDHAVVNKALSEGRHVVYCALQSPLHRAGALQAVRRVKGVQPGSVRVSSNPPALSFVLDARVQSAERAVQQWQAALGAQAQVSLVKVVSADR